MAEGITGAFLAYDLVEEGLDIVIVDKREFGFGSTSASTGCCSTRTTSTFARWSVS